MIDRPGRCQLLQAGISEQQSCYCQSSVLVHCATHTYAHGRAHTNANGDGHTHERMHAYMCTHTHTDADSFFSFLCHSHTHTHALTHFLSLCYAPAVKSQLNNESAALLPFCIEAEELVIACIEQYVCVRVYVLFSPSCSTVIPHGEMSHEALRIPRHACPSLFRLRQ